MSTGQAYTDPLLSGGRFVHGYQALRTKRENGEQKNRDGGLQIQMICLTPWECLSPEQGSKLRPRRNQKVTRPLATDPPVSNMAPFPAQWSREALPGGTVKNLTPSDTALTGTVAQSIWGM